MTVKAEIPHTIPSLNAEKSPCLQKTLGQLIRYGLVGALNTGLDAGLYLALTRLSGWDLPAVAVKMLSYAAGMASSFILNYHWTFRARGKLLQAAGRFLLSNLAGLIINAGGMYLSLIILSLPDPAALLGATAAAWGGNFLLYKFVVFREEVGS